MNKIWIALLVAFTVTFVGCDEPVVVPDPEIVTFTVQPGTAFTSGDKITVNFEAKNAVANENNIGAPTTTSWTYVLTASLNITNIKVTAINSEGKKASSNIDITVAPPYVPTAKDTLMAKVWEKESSSYRLNSGGDWIYERIPVELQKWHLRFYNDLSTIHLYPYNTANSFWGSDNWFLDLNNRKIKFDFIWKDFVIKRDTLTLTFPGALQDPDGNRHLLTQREIYIGKNF